MGPPIDERQTAMSPSAAEAPTHLEREIRSQPQAWRDAATTAATHAEALPQPGERVAVVGCGTSYYMAQSIAALREASGAGLTDAWTPTEMPVGREYDRVLAITRSGTTTEVIDLLGAIRGTYRASVITATPGTPVLDLATAILTESVDEKSVVQTRFATATLAMLRWHLGEDLTAVADAGEAVLSAPDAVPTSALDADQITFVGRGWTIGIASEAALKLRESCQAWTESYSMMEYRHGPRSISTSGRVVWAFGDPAENLGDDVRVTGADFIHHDLDPLAELIRVQLLCVRRAAALGLDPDQPRNLTRSIILS